MLTLSMVWLVLAASVTVIAIRRKASAGPIEGDVQAQESGKAPAVFAVVYGLVLLAGFVYVGWQHGLALIR